MDVTKKHARNLASLCDMWVEELGCDEDEVIVSARDEGHFTDPIKKFYLQ